MAESAEPDSSSLTDVARPPIFARVMTAMETPKAPRNDIIPT